MFQVAVIGAGQLGSRHLQGLSAMVAKCGLYMVDPDRGALERARSRVGEIAPDRAAGAIACTRMDELPRQLDLAIVATSSNSRFAVLEQLLEQHEVRNVVLEKVLFTREDEYTRAGDLLRAAGVRSWVNCPRRMFHIYAQVRDFLAGSGLRLMEVSGGSWGLGCNGIHFADLFHYVSGAVVQEYDTLGLDERTYASKRAGFAEFGGTLVGRAARMELRMTDFNGSSARHIVTLRGDSRSCILDEQAGRAWFLDEGETWRELAFSVPYQSQLTALAASDILERGTSSLTAYELSAAIHLPFIRSLQAHYMRTTDAGALGCPIT